jgi:hypothetical protein
LNENGIGIYPSDTVKRKKWLEKNGIFIDERATLANDSFIESLKEERGNEHFKLKIHIEPSNEE